MPEIVLLRLGTDGLVQFDWTDLPAGASLVSVVHTVPAPLVKGVEATITAEDASTVKVDTGTARHGQMFTIHAIATLSNGEEIPGAIVVQLWDE